MGAAPRRLSAGKQDAGRTGRRPAFDRGRGDRRNRDFGFPVYLNAPRRGCFDHEKSSRETPKMTTSSASGMIAVDKMGGQVLFLNPQTFATEVAIGGFPRTVH